MPHNVRLRASSVVVANQKLLTHRAIDPIDQRELFFLPGGKIEENETAPEAAARETLEETGYKVQVYTNVNTDREYSFLWKGKTHKVITIFYGAELFPSVQVAQPIDDEPYNKGPVWVDLTTLPQIFAYCPAILESIQEIQIQMKLSGRKF